MAKSEERRTDPSAGKSGASPSGPASSEQSPERLSDSKDLTGDTLIRKVNVRAAVMADASRDRWERIARRAHELAEQRGFAGGSELDDWLRAEREIDAHIAEAGEKSSNS